MVVELSVWALYPAGTVPGVICGVESVVDILKSVVLGIEVRKSRVTAGAYLRIMHRMSRAKLVQNSGLSREPYLILAYKMG